MSVENKPPHPPEGANSLTGSKKIVESRDLLGPTQELFIRHGGRVYHLRRTRLGRLILTALA